MGFSPAPARMLAALDAQPILKQWIEGEEAPHSIEHAGELLYIDRVIILQPRHTRCDLKLTPVVIVPGNTMRALIGKELAEALHARREDDIDWLNSETREAMGLELATALDRAFAETIAATTVLTRDTKTQLQQVMFRDCARVWRAKFDLGSPAHLPPMKITLIKGANPEGVRRQYRWTRGQHVFLPST